MKTTQKGSKRSVVNGTKKTSSKTARASSSKTTSGKAQVLLLGSSGRMGKELINLLKDHPTLQLAAAVDATEIRAFDAEHTAVLKTSAATLSAVIQGADVVIDFSNVSSATNLVKALDATNKKIVLIATTGLSAAQKSSYKNIAKKRGHKLLMAGNTSHGVATLAKICAATALQLKNSDFDVEITETHHRMKADAPSGTALLLADMIKSVRNDLEIVKGHDHRRERNTIGIHSVRGGGVFGEHEVRFIGDFEEVCLSHRALSRSLFASGALKLIEQIDESLAFGTGIELPEFLLKNS